MAVWAEAVLCEPALADPQASSRPTNIVEIVTDAPGCATEDVEQSITAPLEVAVLGAPRVKGVRSVSWFGRSVLRVEYPASADIHARRQELAERLALAQERLPAAARPTIAPLVARAGAVLRVAVIADASDGVDGTRLRAIADSLRSRLLTVPGVAGITLTGGRTVIDRIVVSPDRSVALDVTLAEIIVAAQKACASLPGAKAASAESPAKEPHGGPLKLDDLDKIVVSTRAGTPIRVKDLATVERGSRGSDEARVWIRGEGVLRGTSAVVLTAQCQSQTNLERSARDVQAALDAARATLPRGIRLLRETSRPADIVVTLRAIAGASREERSRLLEQAGDTIARLPELETVWGLVGDVQERGYGVSPGAVQLIVRVAGSKAEGAARPDRDGWPAKIRRQLRDLPGILVHVGNSARQTAEGPLASSEIVAKLLGEDLGELQAAAAKVRAGLAEVPGVLDLDIDPPAQGVAETRIAVDRRKTAALGLAASDVIDLAHAALQGRVVGETVEKGSHCELVVAYDDRTRESLAMIGKTPIANAKGEKSPLSALVTISRVAAPPAIYRENGQRRVIVACNVEGRDSAAAFRDAKRRLADVPLPKGCSLTWELRGSAAAR